MIVRRGSIWAIASQAMRLAHWQPPITTEVTGFLTLFSFQRPRARGHMETPQVQHRRHDWQTKMTSGPFIMEYRVVTVNGVCLPTVSWSPQDGQPADRGGEAEVYPLSSGCQPACGHAHRRLPPTAPHARPPALLSEADNALELGRFAGADVLAIERGGRQR